MPAHGDALATFVYALVAGVVLVALARNLKMPAIVLLLFGGMALGPRGIGLIQPATLGDGLKTIVNCAVAVILFEGGLSLDVQGYKNASGVIRRLLSLGVLITWLGTALIIYLLFQFPPLFCLLAGSLVIVTGPTVIIPLLRRIRLNARVHHILHWEGVLIDAVGVFVAVFCFELATGSANGGFAMAQFAGRFVAGAVVGYLVGMGAAFVLRREVFHDDYRVLLALATALLSFTLCENIIPESGLLGVVVSGFTLALAGPRNMKDIRHFKELLTDLLIGLLFILLAAKLDLSVFSRYGWQLAVAVSAVMLVIRPLNIFACTARSGLTVQEKLVLSWIAPRGIVAASFASLLTLTLDRGKFPHAPFLEAFTYSVILATVILQGFSAGLVSRILGASKADANGWLVIGASRFSTELAGLMKSAAQVECVIVDSNARAIREAAASATAIQSDALDPALVERLNPHNIGRVLALTDNEDLNILVCQHWQEVVGKKRVYRWISGNPTARRDSSNLPGIPVWRSVPKPSVVSLELANGAATIVTSTGGAAADSQPGTTLLAAASPGRFTLARADGAEQPKGEMAFVLRRDVEAVGFALEPELVIALDETDMQVVVRRLAELAGAFVQEFSVEDAVRDALERERAFPTGLGHGFAVPHAYTKTLKRHVVAVARTARPVDMPSPDGEPIRLVFLLLSPTGDPEGHLTAMARIARMANDPDLRDNLLAATDAGELHRHLSHWRR